MLVFKLSTAVVFPACDEAFTCPASREAAERIFVVPLALKSLILSISSFTALRAPPAPLRALVAVVKLAAFPPAAVMEADKSVEA